jgi:hypothetical protein
MPQPGCATQVSFQLRHSLFRPTVDDCSSISLTNTALTHTPEISGQYWVFYYSTNTNTPNQLTSAPNNSGVISNFSGLTTGMTYISMYIIHSYDSTTAPTSDTGYDFRIQVLNPDYSFVQCSIGLNSTQSQNCTLDIPISQLVNSDGSPSGQQWPVGSGGTMPGLSYLTVGSQTSAASPPSGPGIVPIYSCPTCFNGFWTNGVWLGF